MASVIELAGNARAPVTFKLVVVTEVPLALVKDNRPEMLALVPVTLVRVVLARLVRPVIFKLVPVALVKVRLAIVPTVVRFGKDVEAEIAKNVLVAVAG